MMIEVVGNGQIKGLIEVAEPFCRPDQNRRGQNRENKQTENDPEAATEQPMLHGAEGATGNRPRSDLRRSRHAACDEAFMLRDIMALRMDGRDPGRVPFMFAARQDRVRGLTSGSHP